MSAIQRTFIGAGKFRGGSSGISSCIRMLGRCFCLGYAGIAYTQGMSIYFWWAVNIAL